MTETELKFQVPAAARARLQRAVATTSARRTRLQAVYADTADGRLAAAGLALRLRKEGRIWVQTLKGRGDGLLQRLEHEVRLPPQRGTPELLPSRHAGTAAGAVLAAALAAGAALAPLYRTDIWRTHRQLRSGGALIEIAFDEGRILAGVAELPVCEIEFELLSGPAQALLALCERWVARHGLWLDVRTKSERGTRLAHGRDQVPAVKAVTMALDDDTTPAGAFALMLQAGLQQALPNLAEMAGGHGSAEQLHQLRVALRRLRAVLRLCGDWSAEPAAALALEAQLQAPFNRLGAARDQDVLATGLLPALQAAGAPALVLPAMAASPDPAEVARDPALSGLLLQVLRLAQPPAAAGGPGLRAAARVVLKAAHRRALADAADFADAPTLVQHRCRKRLKRLRYVAELLAPLFPAKATRRYLGSVYAALEALGAHNDALVAQARLQSAPGADPGTWFALGWLSARREILLRTAVKRLARWRKTPRCWR